jgi:hypothetical protein
MWREGLEGEQMQGQPFHLRPKSHLLEHLALDKIPLLGNPRDSWCYADEDFVGFVKSIARKTKHPRTLESRVKEKLRLLIAIWKVDDTL